MFYTAEKTRETSLLSHFQIFSFYIVFIGHRPRMFSHPKMNPFFLSLSLFSTPRFTFENILPNTITLAQLRPRMYLTTPPTTISPETGRQNHTVNRSKAPLPPLHTALGFPRRQRRETIDGTCGKPFKSAGCSLGVVPGSSRHEQRRKTDEVSW